MRKVELKYIQIGEKYVHADVVVTTTTPTWFGFGKPDVETEAYAAFTCKDYNDYWRRLDTGEVIHDEALRQAGTYAGISARAQLLREVKADLKASQPLIPVK